MEKTILTIEERRARRELKREKQRAESVVRAAKMHEARLVLGAGTFNDTTSSAV